MAVAPAGDVDDAGVVRDRVGAGRRRDEEAGRLDAVRDARRAGTLRDDRACRSSATARVTLALGARVRSDSLGAVLRQQQAPPNGAVSLVDASHRIVARTKLGRDVRRHARRRRRSSTCRRASPEGSWQTETREGTPVYAAFSRSALTGLTVGLALPREEVDGPIRRILWILAGAWVVILGVGAGARPGARTGHRPRDAIGVAVGDGAGARRAGLAGRRRASPRSTNCPPACGSRRRRWRRATASATRRAG